MIDPLRALVSILISLSVSPAANAQIEPVVTVEPVTLLNDGAVAGCGLTTFGRVGSTSATAEFIAFRDGDRTAFAIRARPDANGGTPKAIRLTTTSHDTAHLFPPSGIINGGILETRTVLDGFLGSSFAQELMVMGGRFEIVTTAGEIIAFDLPRPMPHRVRQAYLNCAGDLFRPEAD